MYRKLAIGGGGIYGIKYLGILSKYDITRVERICGSSVGAIIAFFITIGFSCEELFNVIKTINFSQYINPKMLTLITQFGLDTGDELMQLFIQIAKNVMPNFSYNTTFKELYDITKKKLIITGSCLTTTKPKYFNYKKTPNMSVILAIRISISLPLIFTPIKYKGKTYIDGAFFCPNPSKYFKNAKNVLTILGKHNIGNPLVCEKWHEYLYAFVIGLRENYINANLCNSNSNSNVIFVQEPPRVCGEGDVPFGINFNMSEKEKEEMYIGC